MKQENVSLQYSFSDPIHFKKPKCYNVCVLDVMTHETDIQAWWQIELKIKVG